MSERIPSGTGLAIENRRARDILRGHRAEFPLCLYGRTTRKVRQPQFPTVAQLRGERMGLVTIPLDFDEASNPRKIIPICIEDTDRYGRVINPGWFRAVFPIADPLRRLAERILGDIWRVSELAEGSVHAQWYTHRDDLGRNPSGRIYAHAKWRAQDLRAGGRNARRGVEVELLDTLRTRLRTADDLALRVEIQEIADALDQHFRINGVPHVSEMMDLWLYGWKWPEIAEHVGKQPKAATKDFWRWFKKGLRQLNLL